MSQGNPALTKALTKAHAMFSMLSKVIQDASFHVKKLLNHRVVILKLLSYDYDSCSEESKAQNRHRMVKVHASDLGHHQTRTLCRETTDRPRSIITVILTCTLLATMENLSF